MKQSLGLLYSSTEPISAIISLRLVQVQQNYGGIALLGAISRIRYKTKRIAFNRNDIQYWTDLHISNLVETYGKSKVIEVYELIFKLDNSRKAI